MWITSYRIEVTWSEPEVSLPPAPHVLSGSGRLSSATLFWVNDIWIGRIEVNSYLLM
jgi:hypothetical protein